MKEVTPVWLDVANCRDSQHSVPEGESRHTYSWTSSISGTVKSVGGHLHDGGTWVAVANGATGAEICKSTASYGTKPEYLGHLDGMSTCVGDNLGTVKRGDALNLESLYHSYYADDTAMSIMTLYVEESR
jgi:hypothetical protein